MRQWFILAGMACMVIAEPCFAESANADDDEYEEVVIRRKKKRSAKAETPVATSVTPAPSVVLPAAVVMPMPTVVAIPQAVPVTPTVSVVEEKPDEPPPPPEPPILQSQGVLSDTTARRGKTKTTSACGGRCPHNTARKSP